MPCSGAPLSQDLYVITNPDANQTPSSGVFMEAKLIKSLDTGCNLSLSPSGKLWGGTESSTPLIMRLVLMATSPILR